MLMYGIPEASDLTSDFRVGFLLRTPPRAQFVAQAIGTLFACLIAPSAFLLFTTAYPCILDATAPTCAFQAPNVQSWRAVALAMTSPDPAIPSSSLSFSVVFAGIGAVAVLVRHLLWRDKWEWVRAYHPSMMAVAMAFVIPATVYSTAMVMGAVLAREWSKRNANGWRLYGHALAAGLMAGEGIGGVLNAMLAVIGWSGDVRGTNIGCPDGIC